MPVSTFLLSPITFLLSLPGKLITYVAIAFWLSVTGAISAIHTAFVFAVAGLYLTGYLFAGFILIYLYMLSAGISYLVQLAQDFAGHFPLEEIEETVVHGGRMYIDVCLICSLVVSLYSRVV
ncbi:hypothetical protein RUND412_007369 [Rhizina undulata]